MTGDSPLLMGGLVLFVAIQVTAVGWDMPGSWSWENDGVAPRDMLDGVYQNLRFGHGHRYPLFHNLLLVVLCLPWLGVGVLSASELRFEAVADAVVHPAIMTGCALVARTVAVAAGVGTLVLVARMARRLFGRSAGRWAALFAATNLSIAYYTRASNLDGPLLFWIALAVDRLISVVERGDTRDQLTFGAAAALAVATKDQGYAAFILPVAVAYGALFVGSFQETDRASSLGRLVRRTAVGLGAAVATYGLASGAVVNPSGFWARVVQLTGPNTEDFRAYPAGPTGWLLNLQDLFAAQGAFWWPWPVVGLVWLASARALTLPSTPGLGRFWVRCLPGAAGVSSLLFFTLVVGRCEHRFTLPGALFFSLYAGAGVAAWVRSRPWVRGGSLALLAWAAVAALQLHLTQWGDARWQVTRFLASRPGNPLVETYGRTVYQPHFDLSPDAPYRVQRVSHRPVERRNRLRRGAHEIQASYGGVVGRQPDVLVIPEGASGWLVEQHTPGSGPSWRDEAAAFFRAAQAGQLPGYRTALVAETHIPHWLRNLGAAPVPIHGSTGQRVWVLLRDVEKPSPTSSSE